MPLYAYRCPTCGRAVDAFNRIDDRDNKPPLCHGPMQREITACMVFVPADVAYKCPVTEKIVTSERQRQYIMKENRMIDANDFPPEKVFAAAKKRRSENEALAAKLNADVPAEVIQQASDLLS